LAQKYRLLIEARAVLANREKARLPGSAPQAGDR
jgi:hypothetical protein